MPIQLNPVILLKATGYRARFVIFALALIVTWAIVESPHPISAATRADSAIVITNQADLMTPTLVGSAYTVRWSVTSTGSMGQPQGLVTVLVDGNFGCTALATNGQCLVLGLSAGVKDIVAKYSGSLLLNPSDTSAQGVIHPVVERTPKSLTTLWLAAGPIVDYGSTITAHWSVWPVTMYGSVDVMELTPSGWDTVCDNVAVSDGQCDIPVQTFPYLIVTAVYHGSTSLLGSWSLPAVRLVGCSSCIPTFSSTAKLTPTNP